MDSVELGRRIKEARIKKRMTQAELVGSFITRNMLSRIESGNAMPSVKTLEYLAGKLDLPVSSLVPEETEMPQDILIDAKRILKEGNFEAAVEKVKGCAGIFFDEYAAISAIAYLGAAKEKEELGEFGTAAEFFAKACEFAEEGIYADKERKSEAALGLLRTTKMISQNK